MYEAALREVREETGLICELKDLLLVRDMSKGAFSRPDIYFLFILKPLSKEIKMCENELAGFKWVPLI